MDKALFGRSRAAKIRVEAEALHDALIAQVRRPAFYLRFGVPDTFEGRFDLLTLLAALLLRRLRRETDGAALAQNLVDLLFGRLEIAMRELGVSDVAVPKRMKRYAEAFNGRTKAYDAALEAGNLPDLAAAIGRNVLDGSSDGLDFARYVLAVDSDLRDVGIVTLRSGTLPFAEIDLPGERL